MTETTSTKKPAFIAYDTTRWANSTAATPIGVGFSHKDGNGFDLLLDAVPLTGTLSLRAPNESAESVEAPTGGVPAKRPDFLAYVVSDRKDRDGKARWRLIGQAYRHPDGAGFDLLYRTIPLNGRIALRIHTDK
jgi:hypothetical protein